MGSPAVVSSKISWSWFRKRGLSSSTRLRPAPAARTPAVGERSGPDARNSAMALVMVVREKPVSRARWLTPPRPKSIARSATYIRAWNSFNVLNTFNHRRSASDWLARCVARRSMPLTVPRSGRFVQIIGTQRLRSPASAASYATRRTAASRRLTRAVLARIQRGARDYARGTLARCRPLGRASCQTRPSDRGVPQVALAMISHDSQLKNQDCFVQYAIA